MNSNTKGTFPKTDAVSPLVSPDFIRERMAAKKKQKLMVRSRDGLVTFATLQEELPNSNMPLY